MPRSEQTDHTVVQAPPVVGEGVSIARVGEPDPAPEDAVYIGRFIDRGVLSEGGLAVVHRALDPRLRRTVALKILRDEVSDNADVCSRFFVESQTTAQLRHPGIVPIYEAGRLSDGRLYYTMREVHGETLHEAIQGAYQEQPRRWRRRQLVDVFRRVVETVAYAHHRGVVHRDLKPSNIMVGRFGEVSVVDWGLAKIRGAMEPSGEDDSVSVGPHMQTQWGHVMGTPKFMAPEQARASLDQIGPATDVYALGVILFVLLSGRRPFEGDDKAEVLRQVAAGEYEPLQPPRRVPPYLRQACAKAMSLSPEDRYPDAAALLTAIDVGRHTYSVAIRVGVQQEGHVTHEILPLGQGLTLGDLRRRVGRHILSSVRSSAPVLSVRGVHVTVHCPDTCVGEVVDERHDDDVQRLSPGRAVEVDAGAKGWLHLDGLRLLFQIGSLDFNPD